MIRRIFTGVLWLLRLALVIALAAWIYMNPGEMTIHWRDNIIETSMGFAAFVLIVAVFCFAWLYHGWRILLNAPKRWHSYRHLRSLELGYASLNKGLLAVAAADSVNAKKQAKKAQKLMPDAALTYLLSAQAAQLRGDEVVADTYLAKLAQHPDGQLFGMRGQLTRALQRQDATEALRLARQAHDQQPGQPWTIDTLVQLEARQKNWLQVEKTLRTALLLNSPENTRWEKDLAATLCALSDEALSRNDLEAALYCAREAYKRMLDWAPASIRVAHLWQRKAYRRRAHKVLINTWERQPHPDLVKAWIALGSAEHGHTHSDTVERLVRSNPDNAEAAFAMAQAAMQDRLWGIARQHAQRAIDYRPERRAYKIMADIEQADSGDSKRVRAWLDKADQATYDAQWVCKLTHDLFDAWQPLNRRQDFNTILWRDVDQNIPLISTVAEHTQLTFS